MRLPVRALISWFRVSDEEFIERVRRGITAYDRWRRPLLIFHAGLAIVFVGILIAMFRLFDGLARPLGNLDFQGGAFGFILGFLFGAMMFFLAAQIGTGLGNLLLGFRSERLMIRYRDALQERFRKPAEESERQSASPS